MADTSEQVVEQPATEVTGQPRQQATPEPATEEAKGNGHDEPTQEAGDDDRIAELIRKELEPVNSQLFETRAENTLLRGQLIELQRNQQQPQKQEVDEDLLEKQLLEDLKANPVRAIKKIAKMVADPSITAARDQVSRQSALDTSLTREANNVKAEYPELASNPEFLARADTILRGYERARGKYEGMISDAVSAAYAEFVKGGKIVPKAPEAKPRKVANNTGPSGNEGSNRETGKGRTELERQFSPDQLNQIDKVTAQFWPEKPVEERRQLYMKAQKTVDPDNSNWK